MGFLGLLFFAVIAMLYARRLRWGFKTRTQKHIRGRYRGGAALGNALQNLQAFVQPRAEHAMVEILKEPADEEDEGAAKDPAAHLLRQARRIQKGEQLDRLKTLLPP